jgi:serine/threonine protein phosphatase 1
MATYVISDIHGEYDLFDELLGIIGFGDEDKLYILGDVFDRGPHPVRTMLRIMGMPNVEFLAGNHELMAMECLEFLTSEITEESIRRLEHPFDDDISEALFNWSINGSRPTMNEFSELDRETQERILDYIGNAEVYKELTVNGKDYLLVHAGLGNYYPGKPMEDYTLEELLWTRAEYDIKYYEDKYVVTGHTPTQVIEGNLRPGYIYRENNHIAIDCGAFVPSGRLAAICLDTGEEFYSSDCVISKEEKDLF